MHCALVPHPDSLSGPATRIAVDVEESPDGRLALSYEVAGDIDAIRMPPAAPGGRADGLWRHTCFEAFLRPSAGSVYYEFNFSPSTQWAAYRFGRYRHDGRHAEEAGTPPIETRAEIGRYILRVRLDLNRLNEDRADGRLGLAAVIEDIDGRLSYWALAHPDGRPDFHHPLGFALPLLPAVPA